MIQFWWIIKVVGLIKTLFLFCQALAVLKQHFTPKLNDLRTKYPAKDKTKRPWALVTGASDGIGAEYCRQLAQDGFNIVLVSRTLSKLNNVNGEIKKKSPVETKVIVADFGNEKATNPEFY